MDPQISIIPFSPSIFNFQKCVLNSSLVHKLEENCQFFETFVSVSLPSRSYLVRCCKSSITDVPQAVQIDLRVAQLHLTNPKSHLVHGTGSTETEGESCTKVSGESAGDWSALDVDGWKEMDLGRHLVARRRREKMNENELNSGFEVDEDEVESSMRSSNDALCCTSKDIQMLKPGTIKKMRLTVISDAQLPDFLYETNNHHHNMTKKESLKKSLSITKEEETAAESKDEAMSRVSFTWKLLREKIRQIFQSYEIHVKSNTVVDLRDCPLASKGTKGSPSMAFVFVDECDFKSTESDVGKVSSKTEILINHVRHISYYQRQVYAFEKCPSSQKLFGVEDAGKILAALIEMQTKGQSLKCFPLLMDNFHSHGLLIAGPSGCGKSLVVRETVKKLRANLLLFNFVTTTTDLESVGKVWTKNFRKAVQSASVYPTVLLIPKIDECLLIKQNKGKNFGAKLLNHVCNLFDVIPRDSRLIVVATTDKPFSLPSKLRRPGRLEREVYIGAPTEAERVEILKSLSKKVPSLSKLDLDSVARRTPGYVGQDLIRLAHLAILKSYEENCSQVAEAHIKYALSRILPSVLQGTLGVVGIQRTTSLDHIAGLHSVKHDLIKAIVFPLRFPHAFQTMGITPPKGILLHSAPGCAKTTLVRAIAASHQTNFLSVSAAELFSSAVGDSEKIVADLFHKARMASPCILFIDELEAIVGSRQMSQKKEKTTNESILSMLLTEMDGIGTTIPCVTDMTTQEDLKSFGPLVIVVAATNRIDMIDSALIRPGRFDKLIYVAPLDKAGRCELLNICAKTIPFSSDVNFEEIATSTENFTGADIVNLCKEASLLALSEDINTTEVSTKHIHLAKDMLSPSLSR